MSKSAQSKHRRLTNHDIFWKNSNHAMLSRYLNVADRLTDDLLSVAVGEIAYYFIVKGSQNYPTGNHFEQLCIIYFINLLP